ncbi:MAG: winged helix-turn-helix domain-containing protein [Acidobacteriaceae bacterium]|nr:winged helix-turn-helix domain-containing protein [Acidobacteriaceae bacterium]
MGELSGMAIRTGTEFYEFGPFRMDVQRQLLLRAGSPVSLTPKTFQVLLALVRRGHEIVSKDDLMKEVWQGIFVDEANISRQIFMLRKALGESPQDHEYIVTVPGRGYRLAQSVRLVPAPAPSEMPGSESSSGAADVPKLEVNGSKRKRWGIALAALLFAVLLVGALYKSGFHRSPSLTNKDTLVIAEFSNSTGDSVFDRTLQQGLAVQLEQSPFLSILPEERIRHTLRLMEQPNARLTPELALEVCERTGSAAVIEGSITRLGTRYVLGLRVESCNANKSVLDEEQAQAKRKEDVLDTLGRLANRFRVRAGESMRTIETHDALLAEATTASLEALRAYSSAWNIAFASGSASAIPLVRRAIEIDPNFAMAHAYLGRLYGDIGEPELSSESTTRAFQLRNRVTDREKFFITVSYDRQVTGNLEKARGTCELWARAYPRDIAPPSFLSGMISVAAGRYETAIQEGQRAIALDPDQPWGYANLAIAAVFLGRLDEAETSVRRALDRNLALPEFLATQYEIAFLRGDSAEMDRLAARAQGKTGAEDWMDAMQASVLAYSGKLKEATRVTQEAEHLAAQAGQRETAAEYLAATATAEGFAGEIAEARRNALSALRISKGRDVEYGAATALALTGDYTRADALADDLAARFPDGTLVQLNYVPTVRALLSLKQGKPSTTIELLEITKPYEFGFPSSYAAGAFGSFNPVYIRGLAYLAQRRATEAGEQFQNILDHRGIVFAETIGALAHLQLGRAFALARDRAKARTAYEEFMTLWKDADADIPIFREANREYVTLR